MNTYALDPTDRLCPSGHRFLINLFEAPTKESAAVQLQSMFGRHKAAACALRKGTRCWRSRYDPSVMSGDSYWEWSELGYRAYLPLNYREVGK